jgi:hypothetical protein
LDRRKHAYASRSHDPGAVGNDLSVYRSHAFVLRILSQLLQKGFALTQNVASRLVRK